MQKAAAPAPLYIRKTQQKRWIFNESLTSEKWLSLIYHGKCSMET